MGWYVGGAPIEVPLTGIRGFPDVLRAVRTELGAARKLARMPLARVLALLGADFRPTSPDLYSIVSYVDTGRCPAPTGGRTCGRTRCCGCRTATRCASG